MFGWDPLYHTDLDHSESRFRNVNLRASEFNDVNLRDARFENVALTGATFRNVCLGNVAIEDANLEGMTINGIRVTELLACLCRSGPPRIRDPAPLHERQHGPAATCAAAGPVFPAHDNLS